MTTDSYSTINVIEKKPTARIVLARPKVKNAFDDVLIQELTKAIRQIGDNKDFRVVVLTGEGDVFSAGADLNWMRKVVDYTYEENFTDAMALADLVQTLYNAPQATIAMVNGPCMGGAIGLVSACDVAVASSEAFFALREIRLGIVPAVISPYVMRKIGERNARDYFLTGRRFDAGTAREIGLVNEVVAPDKLADATDRWTKRFLHSGPESIRACKGLIARVSRSQVHEVKQFTADMIAKLRVADEGKEGFTSFFEKRKPKWDVEE